jgi:CheY-like chemotaxis protein
MTRKLDGAPVPRHLVFVMKDGAFVVQWDADQVQELLTGNLRPFHDLDYGHNITDYELDQLRDSGRVAHYNRAYVWLNALPEGQRFARLPIRSEAHERVKHFYLNTTLPIEYLDQVQRRLEELGLREKYTARENFGLVAIMNEDGTPFTRLTDIENAQNILRQAAPQLLGDVAVAFIEYTAQARPHGPDFEVDLLDLDALIASQTETFAGKGKVVVGIDQDRDFSKTLRDTMDALGVEFIPVTTGQEALRAVEDMKPDLVLLDLVMPDTHAWEIVAKIRANRALANTPVIIISPHNTPAEQETFALTVAKVRDYLVKPVAPGLLRQSIWSVLRGR